MDINSPPIDLTGRQRITWNVLTSWGGHFVYIVAGFVLPRMIDERFGQDRLGVWDFAWSFVAYFSLVQAGVVSSINRYVAQHRAAQDLAGLNRAVSSVNCVLAVMSAIIVLLALGAAAAIPVFWSGRLGPFVADAQWAVALLGIGLAFQVGSSAFGGVLTGCHRWDLHNGVYALTCVLTTAGMTVVVLLGGGLPALAAAHASGELIGRLLRVWLAYRVCPGLSVRPSLARWATAREMLHFGSKTFVPQIGDLLLNQTISVLILSTLGTAALAVFSRPRALVRHVETLVSKLAYVVAPTASSLQATQELGEVRDLFLRSSRYGVYIALPLILTLAILGTPLLRLWMGPDYAVGLLLAILSLGGLASTTAQPVLAVLWALNAHGRPGLANFATSVAAVGCTAVALGLGGSGLTAVGLAIAIPVAITNGLYVPIVACRKLSLPFVEYLRRVWWPPIWLCLPFALCLCAARLTLSGQPLLAISVGLSVGGALLALAYYKHVLPTSLKTMILAKLDRRGATRAEPVS